MLWVGLDFAPDPPDVGPDVVGLVAVLPTPDGVEDLPMRDDFPSVARQLGQHVILLLRQGNVGAGQAHPAGREIHLEIAPAVGGQ